jgi:hypothetical protein
MNPANETTNINSRAALSVFLKDLSGRLARGEVEWENRDMVQFIEAMSAWVADMDGYYKNAHGQPCPEDPSWRMVAQIILASSQYE